MTLIFGHVVVGRVNCEVGRDVFETRNAVETLKYNFMRSRIEILKLKVRGESVDFCIIIVFQHCKCIGLQSVAI